MPAGRMGRACGRRSTIRNTGRVRELTDGAADYQDHLYVASRPRDYATHARASALSNTTLREGDMMMNKSIESGPAPLGSTPPGSWRIRLAAPACLMAIAGIPAAQAADQPAQQAPAQEATPDTQSLESVVVTATAISVKKLDASYSIVAADAEQIKEANPKSTADLLRISPGIWPESTGGQTGANIEVAGFPSGGDAPYFTLQMMGSPIYGSPTLSFFEGSSAFRLDDTVERLEVVQGGPAVVFGDGQMGATANFILRRGTDKPTGSLGFTYGSEQLERLDGFYGFKIAEGWDGSAGGLYRSSNGIRDPGFKADEGGQFTATLAHDMDHGTVMFYSRYLNDKN